MGNEELNFLPDVLQLAVEVWDGLVLINFADNFLNLKVFPFRHDSAAMGSELISLAR